MELSLKQVAEIFMVSETEIIKWINKENLPAELVADQYRFHRADLLEWAAIENHSFSPNIYAQTNGDLTLAGTHLADALEAGGVLPDVAGTELRSVLHNALVDLPIPESVNLEELVELFLARESAGSTAVGGGIAIPHARQPLLLTVPAAVVRLCYLREPLRIPTPDGQPVDKLFLIICPTAHEHLQLLARLSALLRSDDVRKALDDKLTGQPLFSILRTAGEQFHGQQLSKRGES
jgi:PTS system nitrogen regulatory IIA component